MKFSSSCIWRAGLVARVTLLEAKRQRLPQILLLGAAGFVLGVRGLGAFNFGLSEARFVTDIGFGAMLFFGSILAIVAVAQLFFSEVDGRSAMTVLAKAVGRTEFLLGKYCGVAAVLGMFCLVMTGLIALMLHSRNPVALSGGPSVSETIRLLKYREIAAVGFAHGLRFGVLAAFTLLVASFARSSLQALMTGFGVLVICDLQALAREVYAGAGAMPVRILVSFVGLLFPDFQFFNLTDLAGNEAGIPAALLMRLTGYAACYIVAALALAAFIFRRREI